MKYELLGALFIFLSLQAAHAQDFNHMFDRLGNRLGAQVEKRVGESSDKAVDSVFKKTEETVGCAVGDPNCDASSPKQAAQEAPSTAAGAAASVKCVATDTKCLKDAQARKLKVEIVSEEELDSMVCSARDIGCLQRAQKLGKKVVISD
jgi:hypothetical protein